MQPQIQTPSFTLTPQYLPFQQPTNVQKLTIKNTSLRTCSYEIIISDQEHFKLNSAVRSFSLAPGISKQVHIRHLDGLCCGCENRHVVKGRVRDCNGRWIGFQCVCPSYSVYKEPQLIQYPTKIDLGEFDQKKSFTISLKNISQHNLKIQLEDPTPSCQPNCNPCQSPKSQASQGQILLQNRQKKLQIKNLNHDTILLNSETLKLQFELVMGEHGYLEEELVFGVIVEQTANRFFRSSKSANGRQGKEGKDGKEGKEGKEGKDGKESGTGAGRKFGRSQGGFEVVRCVVGITGFSVSKKLVVRDQNQAVVEQIKNQILTGTTKSSHFYIETQYHQDIPYSLQAYFQTETPTKYSQKWRNISISFKQSQPTKSTNNNNTNNNMCEGILKAQSLNKIQYTIHTNYTIDDQSYVAKYSKILFEDDGNALRMRNSEYSKKYEDMQVQIVARLHTQSTPTLPSSNTPEPPKSPDFQTTIPFKCTIINPSLRCQVTSTDQCTQITIFNQTKIPIPYNFPMHSLYRLSKNGQQSQSLQSVLPVNKKECIAVNWLRSLERCCVYMEIPKFDVVLYQVGKDGREGKVVSLPPSRRRPMTSISSAINAKEKQPTQSSIIRKDSQYQFNPMNRPSSLLHSTPNPLTHNSSTPKLTPTFPKSLPQSSKKSSIQKELPFSSSPSSSSSVFNKTKTKDSILEIEELCYLVQFDNLIKNNHPNKRIVVEVLGVGYLVMAPGQFYVFDDLRELGIGDGCMWGGVAETRVRYRVYGHTPIYQISLPHPNTQNIQPIPTLNTSASFPRRHQISNLYEPPSYQLISKQIKMSFKESKQEFQIIEPILIKNLSSQPLQVNCISIDGEFFKCKEPNRILVVEPGQIGEFKIGFQPENTVRLSVLRRQPPKELRRKAIVRGDQSINLTQNSALISKQIKLLINKQVETITCHGQIIQKSCSIKPYKINLTNCKYGSPQIVETMIITNTSSHKINFIIENPPEISIRPKTGSILPKCTQNCTITFKPCKKISNLEENIRVFVGGSHLEVVPVLINVQDPEIYIKEIQLLPLENAICGTQMQQLNLQMTIINSNPSQSFIQINLKNTPLFLGYTKNYHSPNSGLVVQNFNRCSQIIKQALPTQSLKPSVKNINNSVPSILSSENQSYIETQDNIQIVEVEVEKKPQMCSITVASNSFLIVPLTLRVVNAKIGLNSIQIQKNIASLVGFGQIKSPHVIKYHCNKTLLHINPYKQFQQIILIQSQKNYQISLKNMSDSTVKVKTQIRQRPRQVSFLDDPNPNPIPQPSIICTYKDIQQDMKPETTIDLNMSFICFEAEKKAIKGSYQLTIFVMECGHRGDNSNKEYMPYFTTLIDVIVPEPFLEISPSVLVMPTVGTNTWSRQSFFVHNNGYKQIFIKILKPTNIAFQFDCQIVTQQSKSKPCQQNQKKQSLRSSNVSIYSQQRKSHKKQQKILQNQLTKIHNSIEIRVSFRSKTTISFRCMLEIQDNLANRYQLCIVGTCTDSPFFGNQGPLGEFVSAPSFNSHRSFTSDRQLVSSKIVNSSMRKTGLESTDIEDLLFLNNWIGSLIPQISNQSTFFYVWLTKIQNFIKFLAEFNVHLLNGQCKSKIRTERRQQELVNNYSRLSLAAAFEDLKQQGFQLNSLRIQMLEKADQLQWLNFMWFFLSKTILSPNFLPWLSKTTTQRQPQQLTYSYVQKNFPQILTILLTTLFSIKKQSNNNNAIDWKYLLQNFQPLLQNFKQIQSRRHLILSLNIVYHKLSNIQHQVIQISDFQFLLTVRNSRNRRVRYFLQCNTKLVTCQQSSNKVLPSQTPHGYSFTIDESEQIQITMSLKNYTVNALSVITKTVIDLMDIIMFNNIIWDPITIFHIKLKRKDDIVHHVEIECENRASQEWVYRFDAKISAEYRVFFQQDGAECMRLVSPQPGFLKKGDSATIRLVYSPENMNRSQATLRIANTMVKQVFLIHGKPLHSSKLEFEKNLKIVQNEQHEQVITVPWENIQMNTAIGPIKDKDKDSKLKNGNVGETKVPASSSSRQQNVAVNNLKQANQAPVYILKLFNPSNPSSDQPPKLPESLLKKSFLYNPLKKQLSISLTFKYTSLLRNLQLILQVSNPDKTESKLIRLLIDIVPKPITIQAEIQCQYNSYVVENVRLPNLGRICETVAVDFGYVVGDVGGRKALHGGSGLQNVYKGLFDLVKVKNNDVLTFGNNPNTGKMLEHIDLNLRYSPNENNCYYNQHSQSVDPKPTLKPQKPQPLKKKPTQPSQTSPNPNLIPNPNPIPQSPFQKQPSPRSPRSPQLPSFYIHFNYHQSLYNLTYIFKPSIKKNINKIQSILSEQKKDIYHQCLPLVRYCNNVIYIENQVDQMVTYDVETDLYQVLGKNQIVIKPMSVGKYCYEIFCMRLGKKVGTIKFRRANHQDNYVLEFNVNITIMQTAEPPTPSQQPDTTPTNGCIPKGSCTQDGLRIYNEYFQITSTIRRPKIFSIFLVNLSQKQIEYEVCCNSDYLHAHLPLNQNNKKIIKIGKQSQYQLEVMYLPYFVGQAQGKLCLYNPHQPEIMYRIFMIAEPAVECVSRDMTKIGENKPIDITVHNPFIMHKYKYQKPTQPQQPQPTLTLTLTSLTLNNTQIPPSEYHNHLKLQQQKQSQQQPSSTNPPPFTVRLRYPINKRSSHYQQYQQQQHQHGGTGKFSVLFLANRLEEEYCYFLGFDGGVFGEYRYKVTYRYPMVQRMEPMVIFVDRTKSGDSQAKVSSDHTQLNLNIPFINRFNQDLDLLIKSSNPQDRLKILHQCPTPSKHHPTVPTNTSTSTSTLKINSYVRQLIPLKIQTKTWRSELELQIKSVQHSCYSWTYPITVYQMYQYEDVKRAPVVVKGVAREAIFVKVYPLIAFNCAMVDIVVEDKGIKDAEQPKMKIILKQDQIRKRTLKTNPNQPQPHSNQPSTTNLITKPQKQCPQLQNALSAQRSLPAHQHLAPEYLYQIQVEINTACAMKTQGYFYVYQTKAQVESRNVSPVSSEKNIFRGDAVLQKEAKLPHYFIEKIPFTMKIQPPKVEVLEFEANVGQKSTIKIMIESLTSTGSHKTLGHPLLDPPPTPTKTDVKIQLHNNKCRQFSAAYLQKQKCIEVTYFAQQYSNLKRGKLEVMIAGVYSQYELIGKFPRKQVKRTSRAGIHER